MIRRSPTITLTALGALTLIGGTIVSCGGGSSSADPTEVKSAATEAPSATATPELPRFRGIPLHPSFEAFTRPGANDPCTTVLFTTARSNQEPLSTILTTVLTKNVQCFTVGSDGSPIDTFYEERLAAEGWTVQRMQTRTTQGIALAAKRKQGLESAAILVGTVNGESYALIAVIPVE